MVRAILECSHDVIAILPTNLEKLIAALIPTLLDRDKIMVIILSLHILVMDFEHKL